MSNSDAAAVIGKLVLKGKIETKTPLIIGSGNNDLADIEILRDEAGRPFIPATSFVGVLRHYLEESCKIEEKTCKAQTDYFWGASTDKGAQSALCCHDLNLTADRAEIKIRDGVAIDSKTGIAIDKRKYDYEVVEPGASFGMHLEVTIRTAFDKAVFKKILATIVELLECGDITFGAKTTSGFGRCQLKEMQYVEFDFSQKDNVWRWLKQDFSKKAKLDAQPFMLKQKTFIIDAAFSIKSSLIVRSYSSDPDSSDAIHIQSGGVNVLPGTSIKGAIRARGFRILKTLGYSDTDAEDMMNGLFGFADEEDKKKKKIKSKVTVEETELQNPKVFTTELQHRIKIDRFTGSVINGALFDSMPLWSNGNDKAVKIKMTINDYQDWEAGLLLLILKDLWNEDLPIGGEKNVGRGILKGVLAKIQWDGEEITIDQKDNRLVISDTNLATTLNNYCKEVTNA